MTQKKSQIVMVGPSLQSWGGISSVVNVYRRAGLFDRWPITYVSTYKDGNLLVKVGAAIAGLARYLAILASGQVALLHVHSASRWGFIRKSLLMIPTIMAGKPVVFHLHGAEFINVYEKELGRITRTYVRFVLNHCAEIVVLSARWKEMLADIVGDTPIRVIMNPIDLISPSLADQSRIAGRCLFLGRLGRRKGIYVLLDAVAKLDRSLEWSLWIGGNGDLAGVRKRIRDLGLSEKVTVLGWVEGERKAELLGSAAVLVLPSYAEGLPMSMLEAMAYGTPVITTPVGGIPDLLEDGVDGILVRPGDPDCLAGAITTLLENPDTARKMGQNGRDKFQRYFSAEVIIPQVEALYSDFGLQPTERLHTRA